jgi:hypothetical protein
MEKLFDGSDWIGLDRIRQYTRIYISSVKHIYWTNAWCGLYLCLDAANKRDKYSDHLHGVDCNMCVPGKSFFFKGIC